LARDKRDEYAVFAASDLDWTLARPPRLVDGEETARVEHAAHRSTRSSKVVRADLATFLVDMVEHGWYVRQAPFVATAKH
jgi:putative NADH-flavin reductase